MDETRRAPWKYWIPIADPGRSSPEKLAVAKALFQADERTLDLASIRLRRKAGEPAALLTYKYQRFMFHACNKIPLSTAFVECLFGQFNQWQNKSPKPISIPLLAAKHVSHQFNSGSKRRRERAENSQRDPAEPCAKAPRFSPGRPEWVFKRGELGRQNARNKFIGHRIATRSLGATSNEAFAKAAVDWGSQPAAAKARAARSAKFCRIHAKASKLGRLAASRRETDDAPTLWSIGKGSEFPLHPSDFDDIQKKTGSVAKLAREWCDLAGRRELHTTCRTFIIYYTLISNPVHASRHESA